jgi:hypothetical protein
MAHPGPALVRLLRLPKSDDPGCFRLKAMMANFEDRRECDM